MTEALRKYSETNNDIVDLEILKPDQINETVKNFHKDGFIMVRDVLSSEQVSFLRAGCEREMLDIYSESSVTA